VQALLANSSRAQPWQQCLTPCCTRLQEGLPAAVVAAKQAELQQLEQQHVEHQKNERDRKLAVRYHKVCCHRQHPHAWPPLHCLVGCEAVPI